MLKEEALYGLFLEVKGPHGEVIKEKERIGELGSKEEKEQERKHLQDVSPKSGNNYNWYTVEFFGNSSYDNPENPDKITEDIEDLPTEVEIEYASLNADIIEYYNLEEAIKMYLQEIYDAKVTDFSYYWYDVNTIIVHDIEWSIKESLNDDTIEETDEYKIVKSIQHNFRTVKGVARKGKDKEIYQVYFRTQDFNPATNRWQKTGWANSTSEFDTIEDAREFVKKYGKNLKNDLNESTKIDDFWNLRNLKEPKYGTGNLVLDNNKIRPLTNDEVANKFAVSIEHADKNDLKTKKELIDFANKTGAEKIMFFFMPGDNYSGEYSFLYSDEDKVRDIWKKYKQYAYAKYDEDGNYHEITESLDEDIEKHETLNDKIFDIETQEMLPEVREKLIEIINRFVDIIHEDELDLEVLDYVLIGSNANYNYTKDSDLDVHIIASSKPDCNKEHLNQIYQVYKSVFNKNHDITIHDIPVELYVEMDKVNARSGGIYSIKDNKWLKQPKQVEVPDIDYDALYKEFKDWEEKYFELVNHIDEYENASEEVEKYIDDIYDIRQEGIAEEGEFSIKNLVFKEVRNKGYLDNLKELKTELESKELSLENLSEDINSNLEYFVGDRDLDRYGGSVYAEIWSKQNEKDYSKHVFLDVRVSTDDVDIIYEPDGDPTFVPYGEGSVLLDSGKGGIDSINVGDCVSEIIYQKSEDGGRTFIDISKEEALNILETTEEELNEVLKKIKKDCCNEVEEFLDSYYSY